LHAIKSNEVIHFDYLYIGPSTDDAKYVPIVKHDYISYVWQKQCKKADADTTVSVLIEGFAAFGVALQWVSDQGSYFTNQVMMDVQKQLDTNHHFTTAYSPWENGTVEAVCKQAIRAARLCYQKCSWHRKNGGAYCLRYRLYSIIRHHHTGLAKRRLRHSQGTEETHHCL
jgi:hypothetical protein